MLTLGIFGYRNPDPTESYYAARAKNDIYGSLDAVEAEGVEYIDMHGRYVLWLRWGFWNLVAMVVLSICGLACRPSGFGLALKAFMVSLMSALCFLGCSMQVWTIIGAVWRFNKAGRIVSGDYLVAPESLDTRAEWRNEIEDQGYQVMTGTYIAVFHYPLLTIVFKCIFCCGCC